MRVGANVAALAIITLFTTPALLHPLGLHFAAAVALATLAAAAVLYAGAHRPSRRANTPPAAAERIGDPLS